MMNKNLYKKLAFIVVIMGLAILWSWIGISDFNLDSDVARDLTHLSSLWIGNIVWIGPMLKVGFTISPLYFYLLFPGLILFGGSAYSTVLTQILFALIAVYYLYHFEKDERKMDALLSVLFIGLSSWWIHGTVKLWNGHMYISWLLLSLVSLWHKKKLWFSSLFFGIAVSIHPAVLLLLPLFAYEAVVYKSRNLLTKIFSVAGGLILPWAPIIVFELISKGYLVRQWLNDKNPGMEIAFGLHNLKLIASLSGISSLILFTIIIYCIIASTKKVKMWIISMIPSVIFLLVVSPLAYHYLLPILVIVFFLISKILVKNNIGKLLIIVLIVIFTGNLFNKYSLIKSWPPENRLEDISEILENMINRNQISKGSSYALISVIDDKNTAPQADEYRYLLRIKGFNAAEIFDYPMADYLLIFFENGQEDVENWTDWHSNYFGEKELIGIEEINQTQVVIYKRK